MLGIGNLILDLTFPFNIILRIITYSNTLRKKLGTYINMRAPILLFLFSESYRCILGFFFFFGINSCVAKLLGFLLNLMPMYLFNGNYIILKVPHKLLSIINPSKPGKLGKIFFPLKDLSLRLSILRCNECC